MSTADGDEIVGARRAVALQADEVRLHVHPLGPPRAKHTHQDFLSVRSLVRPVAAAHLPVHRRRTDGLLGRPVRRLDERVASQTTLVLASGADGSSWLWTIAPWGQPSGNGHALER